MFMAAQEGHVEVARLLIEAGVDYDKARTDNGGTPLYIAIQNGHVEIARLLIGRLEQTVTWLELTL